MKFATTEWEKLEMKCWWWHPFTLISLARNLSLVLVGKTEKKRKEEEGEVEDVNSYEACKWVEAQRVTRMVRKARNGLGKTEASRRQCWSWIMKGTNTLTYIHSFILDHSLFLFFTHYYLSIFLIGHGHGATLFGPLQLFSWVISDAASQRQQ